MGDEFTGEVAEDIQENENKTQHNEGTGQEIPTDTDSGQKELAEQKALAEDYYNRFLRLQADFENFKRRARQEKEDFYKYASENLMLQLLPVMDNFERAMGTAKAGDSQGIMSGVEMIYRQLKDVLEREGLKCIDTVGCEFDPNYHEAVMQVESDEHEANTCTEELQKGYILKEKVIRPAMVKVAQ